MSKTFTSSSNLSANEYNIVDATNNSIILTMPKINSDEMIIRIGRFDSSVNTVSIIGDGSDTVDELSSYNLETKKIIEFTSKGINWMFKSFSTIP